MSVRKTPKRKQGVRVVLLGQRDAKGLRDITSWGLRPNRTETVALIFPGFCVCVTHEGVALVLPTTHRKRRWKKGEDRLLSLFWGKPDGSDYDEAAGARVLNKSLEIWPKDKIP